MPPTPTSSSNGGSGVRLLSAARFLGGSNGSRALSFVGGNGSSKTVAGNGRVSSMGSGTSTSNSSATSNYDGKGTYLIFNVGDTIFISDLNSQDKVCSVMLSLCGLC